MRLGVFIERDGVLNKARVERQHQISPVMLEDFRVCRGARPLLQQLKAAGFILIATTNQPALSHGQLSRRELDCMHDLLRRELPLDDILICPHDESDDCPCRKPRPGLLTEGGFNWQLDLDRSFVISDKWQDAEAARQLGCTSVVIESPWLGSGHHDLVVNSLAAAVEKVLQLHATCNLVFA